jgi:hypothetical protein
MTTTIIIVTIATICAKYNIAPEQFDKAMRIIDCNRNKVFYQVESQSDPTIEPYHVEWNDQFHCFSCNCKAGQEGIPCWHKRAALAAEEHYKQQVRRERQVEQAAVEATEEYQLDQLFHELETALNALDKIAEESDERDALRAAGLNV